QNSQTRYCLGIEYPDFFQPQRFVIFQIETDADLGAEAKVSFERHTTNVVWPLPGRGCRWGFERVPDEPVEEVPGRARGASEPENGAEARQTRTRITECVA